MNHRLKTFLRTPHKTLATQARPSCLQIAPTPTGALTTPHSYAAETGYYASPPIPELALPRPARMHGDDIRVLIRYMKESHLSSEAQRQRMEAEKR